MTFIFAALLGNFLAWCVHAFTWWLREKCLWLIVTIGVIAQFILIWPIILVLSDFRRITWSDLFSMYRLVILLTIPILLCKKHWGWMNLKIKCHEKDAFFALLGEISLGILAFDLIRARYLSFFRLPLKGSFSLNEADDLAEMVLLLTLVALALIRPQVVKVQKWLWQQVKPQRATSE